MKQRGATLAELTVTAVAVCVLMLVAIPSVSVIGAANSAVTSRPNVQSNAVDLVNLVANSFRNAAMYNNCPVSKALSSDAIIYTDTSGDTVRYYINNGTFTVVNGSTSTPLYQNASLAITYYTSTTYNTTTLTAFSPTTAADFATITAVKVSGTVSSNGYTQTFTTMAKLANCPAKTTPFS